MKKIGLRKPPFTEEQIQRLQELAGKHGYELINLAPEQTDAQDPIMDCEALMGVFEAQMFKAAKSLKWMHAPSAGVERLLSDDLYASPDVTLTSSSGAFGIAISEYMLCGLLMIQRKMIQYAENQKRHEWKQYPGASAIYGSNVTVVGVGNLGSCFAERCKALGANVTGVRRTAGAGKPDCFDDMYTVDKLDEAIKDADVVALCLPATEDTKRMLDATRFGKMKQGAIVINVGRGSAIDSSALYEALQSGHLGGALLDVTDPEPLPQDSPLWDCPNVVITPHISGIDRDRLAAKIVYDIYEDNLTRYLEGKPLRNVVDRKRGY